MRCPNCDAKLRLHHVTRYQQNSVVPQVVEGWECPECGYDSVYDTDEPVEDSEEYEDD